MRYGVLSDIHANLEALSAVLAALKKEAVNEYVCAGDIIGYGADPDACVGAVKKLRASSILGNHDAVCAGRISLDAFTQYAKDALVWTDAHMTEESRDYLKGLKYRHDEEGVFTAVHGTLSGPELFGYMFTRREAQESFELLENNLLFIGHTHVPGVFEESRGRVTFSGRNRINMRRGSRYIVNTGSVGQPRYGNPAACFAVFDSDAMTVEIQRTDYDVATAQKKIIGAGLPAILAERLGSGV